MKKPLFVLVIFSMILLMFAQQSSREDHSLYYVSGEDLYELVQRDGSFRFSFIFRFISGRVNTGEYQINYGDSVITVIQNMLSNKRVIRKITIPEGYTVKRILEKLQENEWLCGEITTLPDEASLMPNTYYYHFGDTRESVVTKMKNQMNQVKNWIKAENKTGLTDEQILTLASMIEKESGVADERALISSVFHNRLAIKMRLQSDPTIIYAMSEGYGKLTRNLTRQDLFFKSPYNTYRNGGLPPTPICCPGKTAISAAMNPAKTDYLYFVATPDNKSHIFAKDYNQHLKNVKQRKKGFSK